MGDVRVVARARDLWTGAERDAEILSDTGLQAEVDFIGDRVLKNVRADLAAPSLERLVGLRVSSGFRRAVDEIIPVQERSASLAYQLLDDLPTAVLVSGVALASAGMYPNRDFSMMASRADICAGWASDGTIMVEGEKLGHPPIVIGPVAPSLDCSEGDPIAWHPLEPIGPHSTRRCRRTDVWTEPGSATVLVESFFRDTQTDAEAAETVVHEYLVSAELEPDNLTFVSCEAEIGVLPWTECPSAAASAARVVGTTPADLRDRIRQTFVGTSTCTHLNDTLRALACLPYLVSVLARRDTVRR